jgi:hypothetical protein
VPEALHALPELLLTGWAAGLAIAAGVVAMSGLVGPGFTWLTGAVSFLLGLVAAFGASPWWGWIGLLLLALAMLWARNRRVAGVLQVAGGLVLLVSAAVQGGLLPAALSALALGGVTGEMVLGHWYLIDPSLPRWLLRTLAVAGLLGIAADALAMAVVGLPDTGAAVAFWVLMATSAILMLAVLAALRYPAYSGVMSATGLSYLALLTTVGGVFLGWVVAGGLLPNY